MNNYYNPQLRNYAVNLRTASVSKAEKYLWKALLSRKQTGFGFKRQRPIDLFIADFFCADLKLIIEIDGSSHIGKEAYDAYRQQRLEKLGYTVIRFREGEVMRDFNMVHGHISRVIEVLREQL